MFPYLVMLRRKNRRKLSKNKHIKKKQLLRRNELKSVLFENTMKNIDKYKKVSFKIIKKRYNKK